MSSGLTKMIPSALAVTGARGTFIKEIDKVLES